MTVQAHTLLKTSVGRYGKGDLIEGLPDEERTLYLRKGWVSAVAVDDAQMAPTASVTTAPATVPDEDDAPQDASEGDDDVEEETEDFVCRACGNSYSSQGWLDRHIEEKH